MIYAELHGNVQKYRIKSRYGNTLVIAPRSAIAESLNKVVALNNGISQSSATAAQLFEIANSPAVQTATALASKIRKDVRTSRQVVMPE